MEIAWMSLAVPGKFYEKDLALKREEKQWTNTPFVRGGGYEKGR